MSDADLSRIEILDPPPESPESLLRAFAAAVLSIIEVRPDAALCLSFMDDQAIRRLNRTFRAVDSPTDVLSFPDGSESPEGGFYLGDIAVSIEMARRQAAELGHGAREEILILVAHGIIHLLGHDHETDSGEMEKLERRVADEIITLYINCTDACGHSRSPRRGWRPL